jgi:polyisoprenyl-teichoic acid--peptidoglycan teichoic acid transferase
MRFWIAGAAAVSLALCIGLSATVWRASAPVTTAVNAVERAIVPAPEQVFGKDQLRVLVVGLDYDYDRLDQETSKSSRSDIIMALNLDFKNHRLNELSIPRDMVATLPNGQKAKINQAQSDGGIAESKAVIADWLGIQPFDRYVVMRIDTSKDVINAIGGIDVNVQNSDALKHTGPNGPLNYDDNWGHLHVHLKPGQQHLDGEHAVGYARFRHDWCSDPCRIMRQQQVVRAIVDKIEHNDFNTVLHAQQLLAVIRNDIQTDFTTKEELSSILAMAHLTPRDIRTAQVPYTGSVILPNYGDSIVPDEAAKQHLVASMFQTAPADLAAALKPPGDIRLRIENGTAVPGLAARIADDLRQKGFRISEISDAETHDLATTRIESASLDPSVSTRLREALGGTASIVTRPATAADAGASDVTIVLGRDVVGSHP